MTCICSVVNGEVVGDFCQFCKQHQAAQEEADEEDEDAAADDPDDEDYEEGDIPRPQGPSLAEVMEELGL